jgi:hypothetical protein
MRTPARILAALILIPALAHAQRGGGGGSSRVRGDPNADWKAVLGANGGGIRISGKDVENLSPIKLLVDKRKDLALSDDQVNRLKELQSKVVEQNQDSFKALDSLRRASQPPAREPNEDDRARMSAARRAFAATVQTVRDSYDAAFKEALPILNETQQKTAGELVDKQRKDADDLVRDKLGGGRSGH